MSSPDVEAAGVRCMLMRGGSSKGAYFLRQDLPTDPAERDDVLMRITGTPDDRQIDGIGGAHPLTSKVAIVGPSADPSVDVDYLFLQVGVGDATVSDRQNCGNLLAGIGPFAVERGLVVVDSTAESASVRIAMLNTDSVAEATFAVAAGRPVYRGDTAISGVPGTASAIRLDFDGIAGSSCGSLLPTGRAVDEIEGVACTLIDNGMPVVVLRADAVGVRGDESCAELEADDRLRAKLEAIRLAAGPLMGLREVADTTVPKITMVSVPRHGGHIGTRTFIPHRCHDAIGVLGAVSVATAALLPDTPASGLLSSPGGGAVVLEHPTGVFEAAVSLEMVDGTPVIERAGIIRTARKLFDGTVFPRSY